MKIVDLSLLKKDDFVIKAITGEEYCIDGNFPVEFYLNLYDHYQTVQDAIKENDYRKATELMKDIVIDILKLDFTKKNVTRDTLREQKFDSFEVLQYVLTAAMEQANKIQNDPNSKSPTSK